MLSVIYLIFIINMIIPFKKLSHFLIITRLMSQQNSSSLVFANAGGLPFQLRHTQITKKADILTDFFFNICIIHVFNWIT